MTAQPTPGRRVVAAGVIAVVSIASAALYVADLARDERDAGWATFAVSFAAATLCGPVVRRLETRVTDSGTGSRAEQLPLIGILIAVAVVPVLVNVLSDMLIIAVIGVAGGAASGTAAWYAISKHP